MTARINRGLKISREPNNGAHMADFPRELIKSLRQVLLDFDEFQSYRQVDKSIQRLFLSMTIRYHMATIRNIHG